MTSIFHDLISLKPRLRTVGTLTLAVALILSLGGCKSDQEKAREKLRKADIAITPQNFVAAASRGDRETVQLFLQAGYDPDIVNLEDGHTALTASAARGQTEIVRHLLKEGEAEVNRRGPQGATPLLLAVSNGHLEPAELLLQNRADPYRTDETQLLPLELAALNNDVRMIRLLQPAMPDQAARALHMAVVGSEPEVVQALLEGGAPVNSVIDPQTRITPLALAAKHGREDVAYLLFDHGADPRATASDGRTPVSEAIESGNLALSEQIADQAARPDLQVEPIVEVTLPGADSVSGLTAQPAADAPEEGAGEGLEVAQEQHAQIDEDGKIVPLPLTSAGPMTGAGAEVAAAPGQPGPASGTDPSATSTASSEAIENVEPADDPSPSPEQELFASLPMEEAVTPGADPVSPSESAPLTPPPLELREVKKERMPVQVLSIDAAQQRVELEPAQGGSRQSLRRGQRVDGQPYRVADISVERDFDKFGELYQRSTVTLEHVEEGTRIPLVVEQGGGAEEQRVALISVAGDTRAIQVARGQSFEHPALPGRTFTVEDLRPAAAILMDEATGDTLTIPLR